jgi:hypothetical protein
MVIEVLSSMVVSTFKNGLSGEGRKRKGMEG